MVPYVHVVARGLAVTSPRFDDPMARGLWASLGVRAVDVVPDDAEREEALAIDHTTLICARVGWRARGCTGGEVTA